MQRESTLLQRFMGQSGKCVQCRAAGYNVKHGKRQCKTWSFSKQKTAFEHTKPCLLHTGKGRVLVRISYKRRTTRPIRHDISHGQEMHCGCFSYFSEHNADDTMKGLRCNEMTEQHDTGTCIMHKPRHIRTASGYRRANITAGRTLEDAQAEL